MTNTHYIAGNKTAENWQKFKRELENQNSPAKWKEAFEEYYLPRLELRFLNPIKILQDNGTFQGEGFSIMVILCSLIEFIESTYQGKTYRFLQRGEILSAHEYSSSKNMFTDFLSNREPFRNSFDANLSREFYSSIRCGLLHEASTKNGWRIWATSGNAVIINSQEKILYRNEFEIAIRELINSYGQELQASALLQENFIRKFSSL